MSSNWTTLEMPLEGTLTTEDGIMYCVSLNHGHSTPEQIGRVIEGVYQIRSRTNGRSRNRRAELGARAAAEGRTTGPRRSAHTRPLSVWRSFAAVDSAQAHEARTLRLLRSRAVWTGDAKSCERGLNLLLGHDCEAVASRFSAR